MTTYNVPHTFIPGTKANAEHINENFSSVMGTIKETKENSANIDLSNLTDAGKKSIYDNSSRSKLIGEIITSAIPLSDSNLHLLDGAKLIGGGVYDSFIEYITGLAVSQPSLFITEDEWQERVSENGICDKFVYDSINNTIRLPKITEYVENIEQFYYIVVSTTAKLDIEVDIDNISTDLNGKADVDLTNVEVSTAFIQQSTSWGIPDYNSGISLPVTVGSTYTPTTDGVLRVNRVHTNQENNREITVLIDGVSVVMASGYNNYSGQFGVSIYVYIGKGSLMQITKNDTNSSSITFFPLKGAN